MKIINRVQNNDESLSVPLERKRFYRSKDGWFPQVDSRLLEYVSSYRQSNKVVTRRSLENMAKIFGRKEIERGEFTASQGYVSRFLARHSNFLILLQRAY